MRGCSRVILPDRWPPMPHCTRTGRRGTNGPRRSSWNQNVQRRHQDRVLEQFHLQLGQPEQLAASVLSETKCTANADGGWHHPHVAATRSAPKQGEALRARCQPPRLGLCEGLESVWLHLHGFGTATPLPAAFARTRPVSQLRPKSEPGSRSPKA